MKRTLAWIGIWLVGVIIFCGILGLDVWTLLAGFVIGVITVTVDELLELRS